MRWPWQNRPAPTPEWAREAVATIPALELANHLLTFAEQALKTTDPVKRAMHLAKHRAACERVDELTAILESHVHIPLPGERVSPRFDLRVRQGP